MTDSTVPGETSKSDIIVDHYDYDHEKEENDYYDDDDDDETSEDEESEEELHLQKQQQPEIDDESDDSDEDDSEDSSESDAWEDVSEHDDEVNDNADIDIDVDDDEGEIVLEEEDSDEYEEYDDEVENGIRKNDEMLQRVRNMMLSGDNSDDDDDDDDDISEEAVSDDDEVEIVLEEEVEVYDDEVENGTSKNEEMLQRVRNMMLSGDNSDDDDDDDYDDISESQYSNEVRNNPELVISNTSYHSSNSSSLRRRNNVSGNVWEAFDADDDNAFGSDDDDDDDVNLEEKEHKWGEAFDDNDIDTWNPIKEGDSSNANRRVPAPTTIDDIGFDDANKLHAVQYSGDASAADDDNYNDFDNKTDHEEVQVERWLDRDADDPDDYVYAIRRLSSTIYGENDPDNDVDTMLRRSTPKDLYNYLKQQYWYRVHTNQLEEGALAKNKRDVEVEDNSHQVSQQERNSKHKTEAIEQLLLSRHSSSHHQSLESTLAARIKPEEKEEEGDEEEFYLETIDSELNSDEESFIEEKEEISISNGQNEAELLLELQSLKGEKERLFAEEARLSSQELSYNEFDNKTSEKGDESESSMYESLSSKQENSEYISTLHESALSREASIVDDPSGSNYDSLREERFALYTGEYNETLARQERGKDVDEERLYLLELAVRDRLGEELTQDELLDLEEFDAGENREETIVEVESSSTEERSILDENKSSSAQEFFSNDTTSNAASDEYEGDNSMSMGDFADLNSARDITDATSAASASSANTISQGDISISIGDLNGLKNASATNDVSEVDSNNSQRDNSLSNGDETGLKNDNTKFVANDVSEVKHNSQGNNSLSFGNNIDFNTGKDGTEDESQFLVEKESSLHSSIFNADSNLSLNQLQNLRTDLQMVHSKRPLKISVKDPKELEWRKKKIEEELYSMVEEAEKQELKELIDTETIVALTTGALKVALTKKYKDSGKGEYIYFPTVAKAIFNFFLIDEAEKNYRDVSEELPFELATALCTIAALRLKGEDDVDENDIFIKKKTMSVVLDDDRNTDGSVEMAKREKKIKDELTSIMLGIDQHETDATLDADVAAALQKAALDVAYAKKYFDTGNNEFVYFPSVAKTMCNYSLIEEAEKYLRPADREISPDLTKILCIAAASCLKGNTSEVDEDNEDIMKISVDVDVRRSTVKEFSQIAEDSVAFSDASEADREPQSRSEPSTGKQSEPETRNNSIKNDLTSVIQEAEKNDIDESFEDDAHEERLSSATPVSMKLKQNDGSKGTPDLVEDDSYSTDPRSESENDHRDADGEVSIISNERINDPKTASQCVLTPTSRSILGESANDRIDCSTKKLEVGLDAKKSEHSQTHLDEDINEEEPRLKEMGQILEFKRRVDKQKISDDGNALKERKKRASIKVLGETKKLEDDHRIDEARLEEEASLLIKKWLEDDREIDQALADIEVRKISELERIENESSLFTKKQKLEKDDLLIEKTEIETQFLVDETDFSRNTKILEEKLATAVTVLELERNNTDTGMKVVEKDPEEEKGRGFFGFGGGKNKNNDLEREKQRQSKLMEFKLREIELEKDIDDIKLELKNIKEEATEHESKVAGWKAELDDEQAGLDQIASVNEEKLQEQMRQLSCSFKEKRRRLIKDKNDLKKTKRSDDKWLASAKKKLRDKYKLDQEKIERATVERKKMELEEEERLKKTARALEEKRDKEEGAFSLELEAFERKKREHDATIDLQREKLELEFAEEERKRIEAEAEAVAKADEERSRLETVAKAKADEERKRLEDVAKAEKQRKAEEEQNRLEAEAVAKADEERNRLETVAKVKADEERKRLEDVAKAEKQRKAEEEQNRLEAEAVAKADEKRNRLETVAKVKADEERKRLEDVAKAEKQRKAEEEQNRLEAEAVAKAGKERNRLETVAKAKADEERKGIEDVAKAEKQRKAEEEQNRLEAEAVAKADKERNRLETVAKAKADEERKGIEAVAKAEKEITAEEERKRLEAAEAEAEAGDKNETESEADAEDGGNDKESAITTTITNATVENSSDDDDTIYNDDSDDDEESSKNNKDNDEEPDNTNNTKDDDDDDDSDGDGSQSGSSSSSSSSADESAEEEEEKTDDDKQNNKNDNAVQNKAKEEDEEEEQEEERERIEGKKKAYQEAKRIEAEAKAEVKAKVEKDAVIKRMSEKERKRIEIKEKKMLTVEEEEEEEEEEETSEAPSFADGNGIRTVPSHLAMLHQPKSVDMQNEMSLSTLDNIFDPPKAFSNKRLLSAALKGKEQEQETLETSYSASVVAQGVPSHLAMLHQPKSVDLQNEMSLSTLDNIFDPPKAFSNKRLLSAALRGKEQEQETLGTSSPPDESKTKTIISASIVAQGVPSHLAMLHQPKSVDLQNEMSLSTLDNIFDPPKAFSNKRLLSAALKGKEQEQETLATSSLPDESKTKTIISTSVAVAQGENENTPTTAHSPSKTLTEKRRKVEQARERAMAIRRGGETGVVSQVSNVANRTKPSLQSPPPSPHQHQQQHQQQRQQHHPTDRIYHMIRETDRLSGFIRRYENKLETVCKSLLTSASDVVVDDGEEKEALAAAAAAKELSLPEMFDFIIEQNWYKAHSPGTRSAGLPQLTFSSKVESNGVESSDHNNNAALYTVTTTGKSFMQTDGPVQADVGRFLVYLDHAAKVGLTKDTMLVQWKEIARLSGDIQSKRVCDRLNELISFCLDFHMIEKK